MHNVLGAFSSGEGQDFRTVLEAFIRIEERHLHVIRPEKGRWQYTGAVLGDRSSLAWTTWNAEYFGVPQTRRRIFLVADFAGYSPISILFKQESLPGDPEADRETEETSAAGA